MTTTASVCSAESYASGGRTNQWGKNNGDIKLKCNWCSSLMYAFIDVRASTICAFFVSSVACEIDPPYTVEVWRKANEKHLSNGRNARASTIPLSTQRKKKKNTYALFVCVFLLCSFQRRCLPFLRVFLVFVFAARYVRSYFRFLFFFVFIISFSDVYVCSSLRMCAFCDAFFILVGRFFPSILIRIYELDYSMENKKRRIRKKQRRIKRSRSSRICIKCGGWRINIEKKRTHIHIH